MTIFCRDLFIVKNALILFSSGLYFVDFVSGVGNTEDELNTDLKLSKFLN